MPQVYFDCKRSFSWNVFKGGPTKLRVKQYKFIPTSSLQIEDRRQLKEEVFDLMYNALANDKQYMKDTNKVLHAKQKQSK